MNTKARFITSHVQIIQLLPVAFFTVFTISTHAQAAETQGVEGTVTQLKGDFFPGPVNEPRKNNTTFLAVPIYVFKGKLRPIGKPNPKHPQLKGIVESDKRGASNYCCLRGNTPS